MILTPRDNFGRPAMLGNFDGGTVPVKVTEDGILIVSQADDRQNTTKYELVQVLALDLTSSRAKESFDISFDGFAVADLKGSFFMHIGDSGNQFKCTINKCLSANLCGEVVYISNTAQEESYAEIWFFKLKE